MNSKPNDILRRLDPAVPPVPTHRRPTGAGGRTAEAFSFGELVKAVTDSRVAATGRPVTTPPDLALTEDQMARLSHAVDLAEAARSQRAVAILDSHQFVIDVAKRSVEAPETEEANEPRLIAGVDAVVVAAPAPEDETTEADTARLYRLLHPGGRLTAPGLADAAPSTRSPGVARDQAEHTED
ncbi:MAG: hypothetical protein ACF8PN_13770 [Phycisphaerales bacterium]